MDYALQTYPTSQKRSSFSLYISFSKIIWRPLREEILKIFGETFESCKPLSHFLKPSKQSLGMIFQEIHLFSRTLFVVMNERDIKYILRKTPTMKGLDSILTFFLYYHRRAQYFATSVPPYRRRPRKTLWFLEPQQRFFSVSSVIRQKNFFLS